MGLNEPLMWSQALPYLSGLQKEGNFNITILSFEKPSGIIGKDEIMGYLKNNHIQWYCLKYHKSPYVFSTVYDILSGILKGIWICIKNRVKLIHARGTTPAIMAFFISRFTRSAYLFDIRGFMADEYVDGLIWKKNGLLYRIMHWIENALIKKSNSNIVLTKKAAAILINNNLSDRERIDIIPSCVDLKKFRLQDKSKARSKFGLNKKFVLAYVGSLGTWYLLDEMLDFFITLKNHIPEAIFLILTQAKIDFLKERILSKNLNIDSFIIKTILPQDMPLYLSTADMGISFIKPCFSKLASSPTKIGEYLACGLPVLINSGIGDCDEIIRDYRTGIIIDDFSEESYKKAILRLDTLLADEISDRCIEAASKMFSLDSAIQKYSTIYGRLI